MELIVTALVALLALHGLIYAVQNLLNLESAHRAVLAVLSQQERPVYPRSLAPRLSRPEWSWLALWIIILAQLASGALLTLGAVSMLAAADGSPADFVAATEWALVGAGIALLLWFGLFLTIGAALFQMWQTPLGQGAMGDASRNGVFAGVVMLILLFLPTV